MQCDEKDASSCVIKTTAANCAVLPCKRLLHTKIQTERTICAIMDIAIYVLKVFVICLLDVLHLAMLVRALLSWIDPMQEWRISSFLFMVTEPVILPIRRLFERKRWFEGMPIDMPFMITFLLLFVLGSIIQIL